MAHRLLPPAGRPYLDPNVVVARLRDEFHDCDADADRGADDVGDMIVELTEPKAPQAIIDAAVAGRDRSFSMTVADDMAAEDYLRFIVRPDDGILVGHHSGRHEAAAGSLVERCARVLDYDVFLV
jgi:hypothetical protein